MMTMNLTSLLYWILSIFLSVFTCPVIRQVAGATLAAPVRVPSIVLLLHLRFYPAAMPPTDAIPPPATLDCTLYPSDTTADDVSID